MADRLTWFPPAYPTVASLVLDAALGSDPRLLSLTGTGPLTITPMSAKAPGQEGDSALDVIIPPRIIGAHALLDSADMAALWTARAAISASLANIPVRPGEDLALGRLLIERDSLANREIYGLPRSAVIDWMKAPHKGLLDAEWYCPYPYFQATGVSALNVPNTTTLSTSAAADDIIDATDHDLTIDDAVVFDSLTGGSGLTAGTTYYVVAASFGANTFRVSLTLGGAAINFTTDITAGTVRKVSTATNAGDVDAPIVAKVYGPATQVTLTNRTTGEAWTVNVTLADVTEWLQVDTTPGAKTIRKYTAADTYTDAFSGFVLNAARLWSLRPGANVVEVQVTGGGTDTTSVIQWRPRYAGL